MHADSLATTLIRILSYLRRFLLELAVSFVLLTAIIYWLSPVLLKFLQSHLDQRLAFFGVFEPVLALLKLSSVTALIILAPWILWRTTQSMVAVLGLSKKFALILVAASLALFYAGATFCYFITLPYGVNFLLGYQSEQMRAVISVAKFVDFVGLFMLGFGIVFELPLVMTMTCRLGICSADTFGRLRRHAILVIAVLAAVLTPTPDIFNMALMGIPLYILYEAGIIVARFTSPSHRCA